jgi:omega-6 fatty acid desaturase (delta-12 desaturase)
MTKQVVFESETTLKDFSHASSYKEIPWKEMIARYQQPDVRRSIWQLINSIGPYLGLLYLMWRSLTISYWLTLALAVLASGFMVRIFIIFHDCGHGSFFKSRKLNDFWGMITGVITFTPYDQWRHDHARHHASAGDLDRRGVGEIWTLTVKEYLALPPLKRLWYGVFRHPLIMFGVGPLYAFLILQRFARREDGPRERKSVMSTNLMLLGIAVAMHLLIGIQAYLLIMVPIVMIGGGVGVWLFYVQHTFEPPYWEHHEEWNFVDAALQGSSFYKLPKVLQWFTGNIGIHHIHHLSARIPNYKLQQCQDENAIFHHIKPLTLRASLASVNLRLWDESLGRMLSFGEMRKLYRSGISATASNASP